MNKLKKRKIEEWFLTGYTLVLFSFMLKTMLDFRIIMSFIFIYLSLPILIISIFISKYFLINREVAVDITLIYILFFTFIGAGCVASLNGIISPQEVVYYKGIAKNKCILSRGKGQAHVVYLKLNHNEEREFSVSKEEYNDVIVGQSYQVSHKKGGLGIIYEVKIQKE